MIFSVEISAIWGFGEIRADKYKT